MKKSVLIIIAVFLMASGLITACKSEEEKFVEEIATPVEASGKYIEPTEAKGKLKLTHEFNEKSFGVVGCAPLWLVVNVKADVKASYGSEHEPMKCLVIADYTF